MFVLSHVWNGRPLDVLEIGGACGASYFELAHLLPQRIRSWHVVETAGMAAAAKRLFEDNELFFYDDLGIAVSRLRNLDLLVAQGVLQYVRDPLQTLEALLRLDFTYVYITRTVVGDDIEFPVITKQVVNLSAHGPGSVPKGFVDRKTSQPLTIVPHECITSRISIGYDVVFAFNESQDSRMSIGAKTMKTKVVGFLLRKVRV
jgi:putative methyltransferase (TIGR04325 family)